jgi:hypothetical protein
MDPFIKNIQIEPKEFIIKNTINNINLKIINMKLNSFVNICVMTKENEKNIENHTFHITGNEYKAWNNDDNYLVEYALEKLNLFPIQS